MKKFLILLSCFFMNILFSKDYEITPENRESKAKEYQDAKDAIEKKVQAREKEYQDSRDALEKKRQVKVKEDQDAKEAFEKKEQIRKKNESDEEYLRLCKRLLLSDSKCILRVNHVCKEKPFYGFRMYSFDEEPIGIEIEHYLSINGECYSDQDEDSINVSRPKKIMYKLLSFERLLEIKLFYWLMRSNLLKEEKERFEQVIRGDASGTIVRDGSKLFIFDSPEKEYKFD